MDGHLHHPQNVGSWAQGHEPVLIYGGGALGRVMRDVVESEGWQVDSFVDDTAHGRTVDGVPVLPPDPKVMFGRLILVAVLDASARRKVTSRITDLGGRLAAFVSRAAFVSPSARLGPGCTILPHAHLMAGVRVGAACHVHHFCMVGHDVSLEDYCALGPHCSIGGGTSVGDSCVFGQGAVVCPGTDIGRGSVIGAAAYVGGHVPPSSRVISQSSRTFTRPSPSSDH